jgi:hypothetical protein
MIDPDDDPLARKGLIHIHCPTCKRLDWTRVSIQPLAVRAAGDRAGKRREVDGWACAFCGYLRLHIADNPPEMAV